MIKVWGLFLLILEKYLMRFLEQNREEVCCFLLWNELWLPSSWILYIKSPYRDSKRIITFLVKFFKNKGRLK